MEAWGDGFNEPGSREYSDEDKNGSAESQKSGDSTGGFASFVLVVTREKTGINRNEGGGEDAFAEEILKEVGDTEGGSENVGGVRVAEVMGEDAIADQAGDAAEENASRDEEGEALGTSRLRSGSNRFSHENSREPTDSEKQRATSRAKARLTARHLCRG